MVSVLVFYLLIQYISSTIFNCVSEQECANKKLICDDDEDCIVNCQYGQYACLALEVTCPKSTDPNIKVSCNITCGVDSIFGSLVCGDATFNAYDSDLFVLNVTDQTCDSANCLTADVSISDISCPNQGECFIHCNGYYACFEMMVNSYRGELNIISSGERTLYNSVINARETSRLTIYANGKQSYQNALINASNVNHLNMTGNGWRAFDSVNIYCPSRDTHTGIKRCNFNYYGTDQGFYRTNIYTINSFNDINMVCGSIGNTYYLLFLVGFPTDRSATNRMVLPSKDMNTSNPPSFFQYNPKPLPLATNC